MAKYRVYWLFVLYLPLMERLLFICELGFQAFSNSHLAGTE
jgi:hypothetical protein